MSPPAPPNGPHVTQNCSQAPFVDRPRDDHGTASPAEQKRLAPPSRPFVSSEDGREGGSIQLVGALQEFDSEKLKELLDRFVAEETEVASGKSEASQKQRRVLHGRIDIVRAELVRRKRQSKGGDHPPGSG